MKYMIAIAMTYTLLFGVNGEAVFKAKCASCHEAYIPQTRINENIEQNNTLLQLKAPTLTELSFRLRDQVGDRTADTESQKMEIEGWLSNFLQDPSALPRLYMDGS